MLIASSIINFFLNFLPYKYNMDILKSINRFVNTLINYLIIYIQQNVFSNKIKIKIFVRRVHSYFLSLIKINIY